ncbi:MAG: methyl-accepting chemotaxis protein [Candidatus Sericytochromatia bacterium]
MKFKLSIFGKILSVFIALTIPIVYLIFLTFMDTKSKVDFAKSEISGNKYLMPLYATLKDIPLHKTKMHSFIANNISSKEISEAEERIEKNLNAYFAVERGEDFKFARTNTFITELRKAWDDYKAKKNTFDEVKSDEEHDKLIDKLRKGIKALGEESGLILDPDVDTYYLMSNTIIEGIDYHYSISNLRDVLEKIVLSKTASFDQRTETLMRIGALRNKLEAMKYQYDKIVEESRDKKITNDLTNLFSNSEIASNNLIDIGNRLYNNDKKNISLSSLNSVSIKSLKDAEVVFDASVKKLDQLMEIRISGFRNDEIKQIFISLIIIIICLSIGLYVVNSIVKNIKYLEKSAEDFANGNFGIKVDVKTNDELENLGKSFNKMTEQLTELLQETESARETALNNNINLESLIKETTVSVSQIKQTSEIVSDNAKIVAEAATISVEVASEGERAVSESIEGVEKIKSQIESVASKILELSQQTQEISKIIYSVNDIAVQSKFLAFNAAIEASKAGEYGKGFAVVANEIKNLSEESKEATKKISEILEEIQSMTSQSVLLTEDATKLADSGLTLSKFAGETIEKLSFSIQNSSEAAYQISSSAIEQRSSMENLEQSMKSFSFN